MSPILSKKQMTEVWTFVLPLPPRDEQNRIVKKLEKVLPLCNRLK